VIRPLDRIGSIKLKLGILVAASVVVAVMLTAISAYLGIRTRWTLPVVVVLALVVTQLLARGMTSPLREMTDAARRMATGDYTRRVTATSHDEVGELAGAFNTMAADLEAVDRQRRELVANVSHELRTPVSALRAVLENLVDGVATADPRTLNTMLAQVERLGRLVAQLLDLSRLEAGTVPLDWQAFAIEPLLAHAVREQELNVPGVAIDMQVEDPGLAADGDPERVHQVVANLLENAVRYTPNGGQVEVRARRSPSSVTIEVCDQGPGIPDSETGRVFERFYRADHARAASDGGAGLGLAIAQWIVDLHGGEIHPERREPHGCRMVVTLPGGTT